MTFLAALRGDSLLAPFAYHVRGALEHDWHRPDVEHGLPEEGLVVVRPICGPEVAAWYGEPVLDWSRLKGSAPLSCEPSRRAAEYGLSDAVFPPATALSFFKGLSERVGVTIVFYGCATWGGDIEAEYAFVFGWSDTAFVALPQNRDADRAARVLVLTEGECSVVSGDVLRLSLAALDFSLPSHYFAPHTRSFPWKDYALV